MAGVPWAVQAVVASGQRGFDRVVARGHARWVPAWLALHRASHDRQEATVAVAGVVASLSLAVALTVMVSSFRDSVTQWLDQVLPADLYVRSATRSTTADGATWMPPWWPAPPACRAWRVWSPSACAAWRWPPADPM
jgi:hypothetical protein